MQTQASEKRKRKFFLGANWKCNGTTDFVRDIIQNLINDLEYDPKQLDLMVLPGFLHLSLTKAIVAEHVKIGAQNVSCNAEGAFTGEVAADAIKDYEIENVLIGHSERRRMYGETQEVVNEKCLHAEDCQLNIVYCVGENQEQKDAEQTEEVVGEQLQALKEAKVTDWSQTIIVYEPLWAMGTGVIASGDQTQEACELIRQWLRTNISEEAAEVTRIVYGGSVTEMNAHFARLPDVDGFLIGSTSTKPIFRTIFELVNKEAQNHTYI